MQHSQHPDSHTHGLADDCERCAEHAEEPFVSLDRINLARVMSVACERDRLAQGRSGAELRAAKHVLDVLERAGKLASTDPDVFFAYLARWDVHVNSYSAPTFERVKEAEARHAS